MSDLNERSLSTWLSKSIDDFTGIQRIAKFPGGQSNPTYRLDVAGMAYVLRRNRLETGCQSMPNLHWHFAFNLFRLVGIIQGTKKRMQDGNASSTKAADTVARLGPLARLSWHEARLAGAPG